MIFYVTLRGLRIHQGKTCKKKDRHCRSTDRKTRSKSSLDENHSGLISASVDPDLNEPLFVTEQEPHEKGTKRPKVFWPAANEKEKWQTLEERVKIKYREKCREMESVEAKDYLVTFADTIYEVAYYDEFGCGEGKKKPERNGGPSRRQRDLVQLRREKRELRKQWKAAPPEDVEGLKILFEDLKKRCRDLQRIERRHRGRKESKKEREQFLKNPYETAKKLFTETRSGKMKCTKDEVDTHVIDTYSDPMKNQPMPEMRGRRYSVLFRTNK